jgi:hypothetical protein
MTGVTVSLEKYDQTVVTELNWRMIDVGLKVVGWGGGTAEFWYTIDYEGTPAQILQGRTVAQQYLAIVLLSDEYTIE